MPGVVYIVNTHHSRVVKSTKATWTRVYLFSSTWFCYAQTTPQPGWRLKGSPDNYNPTEDPYFMPLFCNAALLCCLGLQSVQLPVRRQLDALRQNLHSTPELQRIATFDGSAVHKA